MRTCPIQSCPRRPAGIPESLFSRREWIKHFAVGSALALTGGSFKSTLLAEIAPGTNPANILKFNLANYPVLQTDYGSMRFNLFGTAVANGIITLTRAPGSVYYAVSAWCTHEGCIVDPYDHSEGTQAMICYCHNSIYDIQGRIISEATPGQADLPTYNTSLSGNILSVEIPNLNFKVNNILPSAPVAGNPRFQISFSARKDARYRILYTPNLTATPAPVGFYSSASSQLVLNQITPISTGPRTLWVQNTSGSGFYMVEMIVDAYNP
jgi:Rieske Fe-S protein